MGNTALNFGEQAGGDKGVTPEFSLLVVWAASSRARRLGVGGVPETQVSWGSPAPDATGIRQQAWSGQGKTAPLPRRPFWDGIQRKQWGRGREHA